MKISKRTVILDIKTKEINIENATIREAKQDKLGRVYIWID